MRKLVVTTFVSMDGVMQAPGTSTEDPSGGFVHGGWVFPHADEDMGSQVTERFSRAGDFLLGRGTYEIFAAYWPHMPTDEDPVATALNSLPKHVASRTLDRVDWEGAELIEGALAPAVRALKEQDRGELQVHGSAGIVQSLLEHDLIDELRLMIFPVVLGSGKRLFGHGTVPGGWRLTSSSTTAAGVVALTYERAGEVATGSFGLDES